MAQSVHPSVCLRNIYPYLVCQDRLFLALCVLLSHHPTVLFGLICPAWRSVGSWHVLSSRRPSKGDSLSEIVKSLIFHGGSVKRVYDSLMRCCLACVIIDYFVDDQRPGLSTWSSPHRHVSVCGPFAASILTTQQENTSQRVITPHSVKRD